MSGLYNMLHGYHPHAQIALSLLAGTVDDKLAVTDFGRFRDAWIERDDDGKPRIAIYTRNGGGNREDYQEVFDRWSEHANYLFDRDDDFDCTYATMYFSIPEEQDAKWQGAIEAIGGKA